MAVARIRLLSAMLVSALPLLLLHWQFASAENVKYHSRECIARMPGYFVVYVTSYIYSMPTSMEILQTWPFNIYDVDSATSLFVLLVSGDISPNPGPDRRRGANENDSSARNTISALHEGDILKIPKYSVIFFQVVTNESYFKSSEHHTAKEFPG